MTIATAPNLATHPPLARDAGGNLVPVPAQTSSLGLGLETGGRPRLLRGPDKRLLRYALHTTPEDVLELCGPGIYRVYALDAVGEQLADEHIARWDLTPSSSREHRNAATDPGLAARSERPSTTTATASTDLRFALETMAQMMRTNSDALRLVAESQVDLAKTIATVKGLPRNAAMYLPPAPPANDAEDRDDDEDEGDEAIPQAAPTTFLDLLKPFSEAFAGVAAEVLPGFVSGAMKPGAAQPEAESSSAADASSTDGLASRPFEARELFDLKYAHRKGQAKRAAAPRSADAVPFQTRVMKDPQLLRQIMAIKAALAPDEIEVLLSAAATWPDADQTQFMETIKPLPANQAIAFCQEVIRTIRAHQAGSEGKDVE